VRVSGHVTTTSHYVSFAGIRRYKEPSFAFIRHDPAVLALAAFRPPVSLRAGVGRDRVRFAPRPIAEVAVSPLPLLYVLLRVLFYHGFFFPFCGPSWMSCLLEKDPLQEPWDGVFSIFIGSCVSRDLVIHRSLTAVRLLQFISPSH